jgi:hypothetical protein
VRFAFQLVKGSTTLEFRRSYSRREYRGAHDQSVECHVRIRPSRQVLWGPKFYTVGDKFQVVSIQVMYRQLGKIIQSPTALIILVHIAHSRLILCRATALQVLPPLFLRYQWRFLSPRIHRVGLSRNLPDSSQRQLPSYTLVYEPTVRSLTVFVALILLRLLVSLVPIMARFKSRTLPLSR